LSRLTQRIPVLTSIPASVHFLSYEPALEAVTFTPWLSMEHGIDWVIVGGESGHQARPFDVNWAKDTVQDCHDAGAAVFVKQLGARPFLGSEPLKLRDHKGGDISEFPEDLRVREFPVVTKDNCL